MGRYDIETRRNQVLFEEIASKASKCGSLQDQIRYYRKKQIEEARMRAIPHVFTDEPLSDEEILRKTRTVPNGTS